MGDCRHGRCCYIVSISPCSKRISFFSPYHGFDHRFSNRNAADIAPQPGALIHEYVQQHDALGLLSRILLEGDTDSSELRSPIIGIVLTFPQSKYGRIFSNSSFIIQRAKSMPASIEHQRHMSMPCDPLSAQVQKMPDYGLRPWNDS